MSVQYSYTDFDRERDPMRPLAAVEYVLMRKDLNNFMHDMLRTLYQDKSVVGEDVNMNGGRIALFGIGFALSVTGFILFDHPGWIVCSVILGIIMLVAILAVPITYLQDQSSRQRDRKFKINSIKSYYLFHYSMMRRSGTYNEYLEGLPETDPGKFQVYLRKYS